MGKKQKNDKIMYENTEERQTEINEPEVKHEDVLDGEQDDHKVTVKKKKHKKRKHDDKVDECSQHSKPKKRKKHKKDALNNHVFTEDVTNTEDKKGQTAIKEDDVAACHGDVKKKKKKKRKRIEREDDSGNESKKKRKVDKYDGIITLQQNGYSSEKKHKKKKHKSKESSMEYIAVCSEPMNENMSDSRHSGKNKKKKKKETKDPDMHDASPSNKKKRKEKVENEQHLNNVQNHTTKNRENKENKKESQPSGEEKCKKLISKEGTKPNFGQWSTADLGDDNRKQKFLRLLGGKKPKEPIQAKLLNLAMGSKSQESYMNDMEKQFEKAREISIFKPKGGGLGYEPPPEQGTKLRINPLRSRSIKFED